MIRYGDAMRFSAGAAVFALLAAACGSSDQARDSQVVEASGVVEPADGSGVLPRPSTGEASSTAVEPADGLSIPPGEEMELEEVKPTSTLTVSAISDESISTQVIRRFLNGRKVRIDVIDYKGRLPRATSVDVLNVAGTDVEVYAGSATSRALFLAETRSTVDKVISLSDGIEVSYGMLTDDEAAAARYTFWFAVGKFNVYGFAAGVPFDVLVRFLDEAVISSDQDGVCILAPRSSYWKPSISQMVPGSILITLQIDEEKNDVSLSTQVLPLLGSAALDRAKDMASNITVELLGTRPNC